MDNLTDEEQAEAFVFERKPIRAYFTLEAIRDDVASEAAGYPIYNEVPHVVLIAKGERDHIAKPLTEAIKAKFKEEWAQFCAHTAKPTYPLRVLPTITVTVVETFKELGITTVDQLATAEVPEPLQRWKNLAVRYQAFRAEAEGKTKPRVAIVGGRYELLEAA